MNALPRLSRELVASLVHGRSRRRGRCRRAATLDLPEKRRAVRHRRVSPRIRRVVHRRGESRAGGSAVRSSRSSSTGSTARRACSTSRTGSTRSRFKAATADDGAATLSRSSRRSVARCRRATQWNAVLALARDPNIELVDLEHDRSRASRSTAPTRSTPTPPRSFPGKLTRFLFERARAFDYDAARGLVVLPCELIDDNGDDSRAISSAGSLQRWRLGRAIRPVARATPSCSATRSSIASCPARRRATKRSASSECSAIATGCSRPARRYALFAIEGDDALRDATRFRRRGSARSSWRRTFGRIASERSACSTARTRSSCPWRCSPGLRRCATPCATERVGALPSPRDARRDRAEPRRAGRRSVRERGAPALRQSVHSTMR